jgi:hypothetical protein
MMGLSILRKTTLERLSLSSEREDVERLKPLAPRPSLCGHSRPSWHSADTWQNV